MKKFLYVIIVLFIGSQGFASLSQTLNFSQADLVLSNQTKCAVEYDIVKLKGCLGTTQEIGAPQITHIVPFSPLDKMKMEARDEKDVKYRDGIMCMFCAL